jgi:hypothetical protein
MGRDLRSCRVRFTHRISPTQTKFNTRIKRPAIYFKNFNHEGTKGKELVSFYLRVLRALRGEINN